MRTLLATALLFGTAVVAPSARAQDGEAAVAASAPDPALLAQGRAVASSLVPPGSYRAMMKTMSDQMVGKLIDQMLDMPMRDLAGVGGASAEDLAALGPTTSRQVMEIMDPAFDKRMNITMTVMFAEMGELFDSFEPEIREGLAEAYAARFTAPELNSITRFLATPEGAKFGAQLFPSFMDPAMMAKMQGMVPKLVQLMPSIMEKVEAATRDLPKPKKPDDLSEADRKRLSAIIGKPKTSD